VPSTRAALVPLLLLLLLDASAEAAEAQPKIVVPGVSVTGGVTQDVGQVITELVLEALLNRHGVRALGPSDIKDMLDAEQQKQLLGCDKESCMAQIAGAMGADRLIAGMAGKLGDLYVVTLKLIDTHSADVTSRSSKRFRKLEEVPDAVGPLVDELLGSAPKPRELPSALKSTERAARADVMELRVFCKRVKAYAEQLQGSSYTSALVRERRALLEDMLHTPFLKELAEKEKCVREHDTRTGGRIAHEILKSTSDDQARDLRRRLLEWREMARLLELLDESFRTGLEKEKNGTGQRPESLPFEVVVKEPEVPDGTAEVKRYLDELAGAQRTLSAALEAVQKSDLARFRSLWTPVDPKRSRVATESVFNQVAGLFKSGYRIDVCPVFILSAREIEQSASRFAKSGVFDGCIRRRKEDDAYTDTVRLKKIDQGFLLDSW
jgi:hypothetical protein